MPLTLNPTPTPAASASPDLDGILKAEGAEHLKPVILGIYGQESGGGRNTGPSVDGAVGGMQVIPATFQRLAREGERIDNPADNMRVGVRLIKSLGDRFGNDPARIAAGYFSGEGNVNAGEGPAWKRDHADGNGKRVSGYVADVLGRLLPSAHAETSTPPGQDYLPWGEVAAKPEFKKLTEAERDANKRAYFLENIAPQLRTEDIEANWQAFAEDTREPSMIERGATAIQNGLKHLGLGDAPAIPPRAELPTTSRVPVKPELRAAFNAQWDAATPEQRAAMQQAEGWQGMLARERAGVYEQFDRTLPEGQTRQALDTRREARQVQLVGKGEDPRFAERAAVEGARAGALPGQEAAHIQQKYGTVEASDFDFDTADLFNPNKPNNGLNNPLLRGLAQAGIGSVKAVSGFNQALAETVGADEYAAWLERGGDWARNKESAVGTRGEFLERNLEGAIRSTAQQLPLLLGAASGGMALPLAGMAVQSFGEEYSDGRAQGLDHGQAAARGGLFAAFEVIGERFGLKGNLKGIREMLAGKPNDAVATSLSNLIKRELPGELFTTTGQFAVDKFAPGGIALRPGATFEDYLGQVADTIAQTVMQGGLMAGGGKAVGHLVGQQQGADQETRLAEGYAETAKQKALDAWSYGLAGRPLVGAPASSPTAPVLGDTTPPGAPAQGILTDAEGIVPPTSNPLASELATIQAQGDQHDTEQPGNTGADNATGGEIAAGEDLRGGGATPVDAALSLGDLHRAYANLSERGTVAFDGVLPAEGLPDGEMAGRGTDGRTQVTRQVGQATAALIKIISGRKTVFLSGAGVDGLVISNDPEFVYLSSHGSVSPIATGAHEIGHAMRSEAPDAYAGFVEGVSGVVATDDAVLLRLAKTHAAQAFKSVNAAQRFEEGEDAGKLLGEVLVAHGRSKDWLIEELHADLLGDAAHHQGTWRKFAEHMAKTDIPGLKQFVTYLDRMIARLNGAEVNGAGGRTPFGSETYVKGLPGSEELARNLKIVRDEAAKALASYAQLSQKHRLESRTPAELKAMAKGHANLQVRSAAQATLDMKLAARYSPARERKLNDDGNQEAGAAGQTSIGQAEAGQADRHGEGRAGIQAAAGATRGAVAPVLPGRVSAHAGGGAGAVRAAGAEYGRPDEVSGAGVRGGHSPARSLRITGEPAGTTEGAPSYGAPRQGAAEELVAVHFSREQRSSLSGSFYGQGAKGAEAKRLSLPSAKNGIQKRVYFYIDEGRGVRPEPDVGAHAHVVLLNNLYDAGKDVLGIWAERGKRPGPLDDAYNWAESQIVARGFDGYYARAGFGDQGVAVLLGSRNSAVPIKYLGANNAWGNPPAKAVPVDTGARKKALLSEEIRRFEENEPAIKAKAPSARLDAGSLHYNEQDAEALKVVFPDIRFSPARVMFEVAPDPNDTALKARWDALAPASKFEISGRVATRIMPEVFDLAGVRAKMETQIGGYMDTCNPSFAAVVEDGASALALMDVARLAGFALRQASMMVISEHPFEGATETGIITVNLPADVVAKGLKGVHDVYRMLRAVSPEHIQGHSTVGSEMMLAVPFDQAHRLADLVAKALPGGFHVDDEAGYLAYPEKKDYDYGSDTREGASELLAKREDAYRLRAEASAALEAELARAEAADRGQGGTSDEVVASPQRDLFAADFISSRASVSEPRVVSTNGDTATYRLGNTNSTGGQIAHTRQGLENFWKWYGDGPVDSAGKPVLLYHSTNGDITAFQAGRKTTNDYGFLGPVETSRAAIFATPNPHFSQEYLRGREGRAVMPVYMAMQNPFDLRKGLSETQEQELEQSGISLRWLYNRSSDWELFDNEDDKNDFVAALKKLEYDGAVFFEDGQDGKRHLTYAVFEPSSIKSATGNRGSFNAVEADIRLSPARRRAADVFAELAQEEDTFQYPRSAEKDLKAVFAEVAPGFSIKRIVDAKGRPMIYADAERRGVKEQFRIITPEDQEAMVYQTADGLWIDASKLTTRKGGGSRIYSALFNYAYNNGLAFQGDPQGVSDLAIFRRTENMLSSALKFGTTRHMRPAGEQMNPALFAGKIGHNPGVLAKLAPLKWEEGDHAGNLDQLLAVSYTNGINLVPELKDVRFDFDAGIFRWRDTAAPVTGREWADLGKNLAAALVGRDVGPIERSDSPAEMVGVGDDPRDLDFTGASPGASPAGPRVPSGEPPAGAGADPGSATVKRIAFLGSLLRDQSEEGRRAVLDRASGQLSRFAAGELKGLLYSPQRHALLDEAPQHRTLDGAELTALRRAAARIERPRDGVTLHITGDGEALATGPKGARVPRRFVRFAQDHGLKFMARRKLPQPTNFTSTGIQPYTAPMPIEYRESGALYFNEIGKPFLFLDRTRNTRFSPARFYSPLARAIETVPARLKVQPASQWALWLKSNAAKLGVKQDEIQWSGIEEYLALRGREKLPAEAIQAFLRSEGVRVEDTVLGEPPPARPTWWWQERISGGNNIDGDARYAAYTVPGGENYRELLITLRGEDPPKPAPSARPDIFDRGHDTEGRARFDVVLDGESLDSFSTWSEATAFAYDHAQEQDMRNAQAWQRLKKPSFTSSHFDQRNILAHLRFDDRVDADGGKVLFIQEIQSDWGQAARKNGLALSEVERRQINAPANTAAEYNAREELIHRGAVGVSPAPFVTDTKAWVALGLKRAILHAVEGGYDKVALISGEQAADLYDLGKQVSRVDVSRRQDGSYYVAAYKDPTDTVRVLQSKAASEAELADLLGKDLAEKAAKQPRGTKREYTGLDLQVGGDGMKAFYNRLVPQVANEVLRKLGGGKVETVEIDTRKPEDESWTTGLTDADIQKQLGFTITDKMREQVLNEGVPLFSPARRLVEARDRVITRLDAAVDGLSGLPNIDAYNTSRNLAMGRIARVDAIATEVRKTFSQASDIDKARVYEYLTTRGAQPNLITDGAQRAMAERVKTLINYVGDQLVARGLIDQASRDAYRDQYLPRLYLKHLMSDQVWKMIGAGKKPSDLGYTMKREEIPQDIRDVILGEVKDPEYLSVVAVSRSMRDMAILDWIESLAQNTGWVYPQVMVDYGGRRVSAYWLQAEADRIEGQAEYYDPANKAKAEALVKKLRGMAHHALNGLEVDHKLFKQLPNTKRYGMLRGMYVREEIYNDLMGMAGAVDPDPSWYSQIFGLGHIGTKATQAFKTVKVALNPPGQIRNFVSNMLMLQLSGIGFHMLPVRMVQAVNEIRTEGPYWKVAKKYGVTGGTFSANELYRTKDAFLALQKEKSGNPLAYVMQAGRAIANTMTDAYQFTEALGKVMKIIDEMKKGRTAAQAAIEANKWLFDYSLVPKAVRELRNAPVGAPFITYQVKVLPRILEVLLTKPWRLVPYVAVHYAMFAMAAAAFGADEEDFKKLRKALPEWLRDNPFASPLPWKDDEGRVQFFDMSYLLPFSWYAGILSHLKEGEPVKALQDVAGQFSAPVIGALQAMVGNYDSFTRKPIASKGDPLEYQVEAYLNYVWDLAVPPIMGSHGVASPMGLLDRRYGGKLTNALTGTTNKFGDARSTLPQALWSGVGMNAYSVDPEHSQIQNIQQYMAKISDAERSLKTRLADRGLSDAERAEVMADYTKRVRELGAELLEYRKGSEVPEPLKARR